MAARGPSSSSWSDSAGAPAAVEAAGRTPVARTPRSGIRRLSKAASGRDRVLLDRSGGALRLVRGAPASAADFGSSDHPVLSGGGRVLHAARSLVCCYINMRGSAMDYVNELGLLALGSRLRALSDRLYALADQVYQAQGLEIHGRWFPVLRLLHDRGPHTVGEIAEAIGQTHSAVSQLADRLVREGWLTASADDGDRRRRRLAVTAKASTALREAKPAGRAIREALQARSEAAGIDVLGTLDRLSQLLDAGLVDEIASRTQALRSDALRVVGFRPELREHFYRLNAAWLRRYFYLEEIDHRVLSNPEDEILATGGELLFAQLGDDVVGTCALLQERPGEFELTKMAVDERYQSLGIGRRLIEAAIAAFEARGGGQLFLETNSKLAPAIRLYESAGFERQPTRKADSHYQRSDVYMIWRRPERADHAGTEKVATSTA
jgi:ribosomal protein S18 acetylase RimI-like enzyme/predicted transcriptional regulator